MFRLVLCCDSSNKTKPSGAHLVQEQPGGAAQGVEDKGIIIMSHLENLPQWKSPATTRRRPGRMERAKAWETREGFKSRVCHLARCQASSYSLNLLETFFLVC